MCLCKYTPRKMYYMLFIIVKKMVCLGLPWYPGLRGWAGMVRNSKGTTVTKHGDAHSRNAVGSNPIPDLFPQSKDLHMSLISNSEFSCVCVRVCVRGGPGGCWSIRGPAINHCLVQAPSPPRPWVQEKRWWKEHGLIDGWTDGFNQAHI